MTFGLTRCSGGQWRVKSDAPHSTCPAVRTYIVNQNSSSIPDSHADDNFQLSTILSSVKPTPTFHTTGLLCSFQPLLTRSSSKAQTFQKSSLTMANGDDNDAGAVGKESINTEIVTLTRYLTEEQSKHKEATGDFT